MAIFMEDEEPQQLNLPPPEELELPERIFDDASNATAIY